MFRNNNQLRQSKDSSLQKLQKSVEVVQSHRLRFEETPEPIITKSSSKPISVIKLRGARIESEKEKSLARATKLKEQED